MPSEKTNNYIIYGIGVFLIIVGLQIGFSWPIIFKFLRKEKLELSPNSETYKLWVKTPIPMYLELYLFNWTNSEEFLKNKKVKPEFEEVGPFVFKEVHERVSVVWNNNSTVSYNQKRTWNFVPEESVDLNTKITNLNVIATTVTRMASNYKNILKLVIDFLTVVYKEKLIITRPASQWLFDGMKDKLLDFIKTFLPVPYNKFGWFYARNLSTTFDGRFNVKTGQDSIFNLGMMDRWNNVNHTKFFKDECGVVKGSSGELFAPMPDFVDNLTVFISDFCGTFTLNNSGIRSVEGVDGFHFVGDENVFDNGTKYPSSKCYCSGDCSPSGVRNVTSCRTAPLFVSYPHFYLADSSYTEAVGGMYPNKSDHEFYISIDTLSGIPLDVRAQLQINVLLQPMKQFHMFAEVPKVYVPMVWFRQRARITPELASKGQELKLFGKIGLGLGCGIAFFGLLIILLRIFLVEYRSRSAKFESLIAADSEKEEESNEINSEEEG